MKQFLSFLMLLIGVCAHSQNVGIGTTTPATDLHVVNPSNAAIIRVQPAGSVGEAALELQTSGTIFDFLELRKWKTGASGTIAGIPLSGLSQLTTGTGAGSGLMVGTKLAQPLYFTTANTLRMQIDETGRAAFNVPVSPITQFSIETSLATGLAVDNTASTGQRIGVLGSINTSIGAGLSGTAYSSSSASPFETGAYGILGRGGSTTIGGGFFNNSGVALRARSSTGVTLHTSGSLRLDGIGEAANRVLTSDASGNATWQSLPASSSAWTVSGNNIYNNNTGNVGIGVISPEFGLHLGKTLFLNSFSGSLALGYPGSNHWRFATNEGGADLLLRNGTGNDFGADVTRMYIRGDGNIGIGVTASNLSKLDVVNSSTTTGSGVAGITSAPRSGALGYAGVSGDNPNAGTDRFGVIGQTSGTSSGSAYSAGVGGYGDYGVLGWSQTNGGAGVIAQHGSGKNAIEINNGFIKVSGTSGNKTAFVHTATAANTDVHITRLAYASPLQTDIVMVTPNYNPAGAPSAYNNHPIGVFWNGNTWTIFNQDIASILNTSYNVLVIRQ